MSTLRVTVEKLVIHKHPNADALELAQVGLYRAVVAKGMYRTGDYALYIPEQAVLPDPLIEELGLTGRLAGKEKNRVKAIRLRGELSQGIVCRPDALWGSPGRWPEEEDESTKTDFAEILGITKWVPPIPVAMSGKVESAPDLMRWIEIENIKRYPDVFEPGEEIVATEKIHGTACLVTYVTAEDRVYVSSKGLGEQNLALIETPGNVYWRAIRAYKVPEAAKRIALRGGFDAVGIFGEVYGQGIQDLHYGKNARQDDTLGYAMFDIAVRTQGWNVDCPGSRVWFSPTEKGYFAYELLGIPEVPVIYEGPFNRDLLMRLAQGKETVSGAESHIREGIVVRPENERYSPVLGGRAIAKFVSDDYLTRKGGTEYE